MKNIFGIGDMIILLILLNLIQKNVPNSFAFSELYFAKLQLAGQETWAVRTSGTATFQFGQGKT